MTPRRPDMDTTDTDMDIDRFRRLADVHGGDLDRWPEADRTAAEALLARDAAARALHEDARTLDAWLATGIVDPPPAHLRRRILADAGTRVRPSFLRTVLRELGGPRVAGPALAASLVLGIGAALVLEPATSADMALDPEAPDAPEAPGYAELAQLAGTYQDYLP